MIVIYVDSYTLQNASFCKVAPMMMMFDCVKCVWFKWWSLHLCAVYFYLSILFYYRKCVRVSLVRLRWSDEQNILKPDKRVVCVAFRWFLRSCKIFNLRKMFTYTHNESIHKRQRKCKYAYYKRIDIFCILKLPFRSVHICRLREARNAIALLSK